MQTPVFVNEEAAKEYLCGICLHVMIDPVQIGCSGGHTFCKQCINEFIQSKSSCSILKCPICATKFNTNSMSDTIKFIERKINDLKVKCPHPPITINNNSNNNNNNNNKICHQVPSPKKIDTTENSNILQRGKSFSACQTILDILKKEEYSKSFLKPNGWVKTVGMDVIIKQPMDLSIIETKLNNKQYRTPYDFANDMRLIYQNAVTFNYVNVTGECFNDATKFAKKFEAEFERLIINGHETNEFTRKIAKVIQSLITHHLYSMHFVAPVDPQVFKIPHYLDVIDSPMDLGTIMNKIHEYNKFDQFVHDLFLIWDNCCKFNSKSSTFHRHALILQAYSIKQLKRLCKSDYQQWKKDSTVSVATYCASLLTMNTYNIDEYGEGGGEQKKSLNNDNTLDLKQGKLSGNKRKRIDDEIENEETPDTKKRKLNNTDNNVNYCDWIGRYGDLNDHIMQCPLKLINCRYSKNGCKAKIARKQISTHKCPYAPIRCTECNEYVVLRNNLLNHLSKQCPVRMIKCDQCGDEMIRMKIPNHLKKECGETMIKCYYWSKGCDVIKRKDITAHNKKYVAHHLKLLSVDHRELKANYCESIKNHYDLQKSHNKLEKKHKKLEKKHKKLTKKYDHLKQQLNVLSNRYLSNRINA